MEKMIGQNEYAPTWGCSIMCTVLKDNFDQWHMVKREREGHKGTMFV